MAEQIQAYPAGLLEVLGVKSLGVTPNELPNSLQASLELIDFYGLHRWELTRVATVGAVEGGQFTLTVPGRELWYLKALTMTQDQTAGITQLGHSIRVKQRDAIFNTIVAERVYGAFKAGIVSSLSWQPPTPWFLQEGSIMTATVELMTGGAGGNLDIRALYYKFNR